MKLKIRVDNTWQTLELDENEKAQLCISLDVEGEALSEKEREALIQEAWDREFNRPEYNNWHKFNRHRGEGRGMSCADENEEIGCLEPLPDEVADDRIFRREELEREEKWSYEAVCEWVRKTLVKKPHWAEAFISVRLDGMSVNDYAASIGVSDASVISKWLSRAEKKLRNNFQNRQI